jgi:hypothetical protein
MGFGGRSIPFTMRHAKILKTAALVSIPLVGLGWYLFRPELLFVNKSVNEAAPSAESSDSMELAKGTFSSYAHETVGTAQVLNVGGKKILRLSGFHTSNGPDVRVYLVKGSDPTQVKEGQFVDLGEIKGNIGDQNYDLPDNAGEYGSVVIWCRRFSVGFGGATLAKTVAAATFSHAGQTWSLASFAPETVVTSGKFRADAPGVKGKASLIEADGKRFVRLEGVKAGSAKDVEVWLVKKESIPAKADISSFTKVRLGTLNPGMSQQQFSVSKDLDLWLYRTVTLSAPGSKSSLGTAPLRSAQEKPGTLA